MGPRGVTCAVVEIDGWKWQDLPGSDHILFDADEDGYPYHDDPWRGRDGKRVPVSMRDTIVALWPTSPIDRPLVLRGRATWPTANRQLRTWPRAEEHSSCGSGAETWAPTSTRARN